eukprot:597199-Hanusia_phi.AAC.1
MVFFPSNPPEAKSRKLSVEAVREVIKVMKEQSVLRGVLVVESKLMNHAQLTIDTEAEQHRLANDREWRIE